MSLVDVLLVVACVLAAVSGFRQGLLVGAASFVGFVVGGVVGMLVTPDLVASWEPGIKQVVVAVGVVVVLATIGQVVCGFLASRVRDRLTWRPARAVDATLGAGVSIVAVLVIAWFVALALRQAPIPAVAREVSDSRILAAVDNAMPVRARTLFGSFRRMLGDSGFPQVFGGLSPERIARADPPDRKALTPAVSRAAASIVRVDGDAPQCSRSIEGSGFVYSPERVITNAHVVAGVDRPTVRVGGRGKAYRATVVAYDSARDVAVLDVPGLDAPPLTFDATGSRGDSAVVAGFPRGGPYRLDAARIRERIEARGPDIYGTRQVARQVFSLYATIQPGNSGGPLLSPQGKVYGVVFAKSLDDPDTGYALTVQEVRRVVDAGRSATARVSTGACAA